MRTAPDSWWIWGPPLVALLLLAAVAVAGSNQGLFLVLNHAGHVLGDDFWDNMSILGDGAVALAFVLPAIRRFPQQFWAALYGAILTGAAVQGCKRLVPFPRPLAVLPPETFFHSGEVLRAVSFPSGHAATIFILTGIWIISLSGHHLLRALLLMLAVVVATSRIMVGVHWPIDVLAGMLVGWVAAYAGLALAARLQWRTSGVGGLCAGVLLMVVAGSLLFSTHTGYPAALAFQRLVGALCLACGAREIYLMLAPRRIPGSGDAG